ncbi:hypothetical protein O6H91_04G032500 [Diphasiastrum complanatum]|uniref:Uncharacterized protein n=2 Tax=Diphasiastrum complanatum TaxID=34168 RepID=A0ACC2DVY7_DIPCM|nr:hypothetical protein O6H91_04G032500 [Diphasiastrum complanatum]KAJ7558293.1 hypothetical protein O6H91_04G032500 [Diphasiastrum complanatum]
MFQSLDYAAEEHGRESNKRKSKKLESSNKSSEEEGDSTAAMLPMFKRKKSHDEWLLHEDSSYARFSGERLFEGQSIDKEMQQQGENGMRSGILFPENEHVSKKLQPRRKSKFKKVTEEDKVANGCRDDFHTIDGFHSESPWIDSMRTCMQACMQEITESRKRVLAWMREEMQNFLYRETLTSGLQMAFPEQGGAGVGYGAPQIAGGNLNFEPQIGEDTGLSFEGQGCALREQNFGTKTEGIKFGDTFPDAAGMGFGRKDDAAETKKLGYGGQSNASQRTHLGVQTNGHLRDMCLTARRSQIYTMDSGGHSNNGIAGVGITEPGSGSGGNFSGLEGTQGSNYGVPGSLATGNPKSTHAHGLESALGSHLQNNLNMARVQGAISGVQNPLALGMMWNMMHNAVGGTASASNHGIVSCTSGMANKISSDMFLGNSMGYENHLQMLNSSLLHGANPTMGMQLPLALQTSPTGSVQSLAGIPTAVGMQSPVGMQSFINLGMAGNNVHMGSAMSGQFFQNPALSENMSLEKSTNSRELVIPTLSVKKNYQAISEHGFSKSRA